MSSSKKSFQVEVLKGNESLNVCIEKKSIGKILTKNNLFQALDIYNNFLGNYKREKQAIYAVIANYNLKKI